MRAGDSVNSLFVISTEIGAAVVRRADNRLFSTALGGRAQLN